MKSTTTLGKLLAKHRERLGKRVSLEEIFRLHDAGYSSDSLSEEERIEILDRVAADPEAAYKLRNLIRFPEDPPGVEVEGVEERWTKFQSQLPSALAKQDDLRRESPPQFETSLGWQGFAGLTAVLLFCTSLAFWAGRSISPDNSVSHGSGIQLNTIIVELSMTEQRNRGALQVSWPSDAEGMMVAISAPRIQSQAPLDLVIVGETGRTVAERSGLVPGSAGLYFATFRRDLLPPGSYKISLRNRGQGMLISFDLEVYPDQ